MAKATLQVKSIASILITVVASVSWGIFGRRFDSHAQSVVAPLSIGLFAVFCQISLIFIESKEEEELSLSRKARLAGEQQAIAENEQLSKRIQDEIAAGNPEAVAKWVTFRRNHYGK